MKELELEPGDTCGRYEIVKPLAQGAHGQVYLARTPDGDLRALKILKAQFIESPDVLRRFAQEALLLSKIDSPHVVRVFDSGVERAHPWYAMEYLRGLPLRRVVLDAGGRLDVDRALLFMRQLARGAHAAHLLKAIHRDLKPENIIVLPGDVLKIVDFGISKILGWAVPSTSPGEGFCTPLYAAPEQVDGSDRRADARTDVYAIGLIAWEMIVGRNPFTDPDGDQHSMEITMSLKLTKPVRRVGDVLTGFPDYLSDLIAKACAIAPEDRHDDAYALAEDVGKGLKRWRRETRAPGLPAVPPELEALAEAARTDKPLSSNKKQQKERASAPSPVTDSPAAPSTPSTPSTGSAAPAAPSGPRWLKTERMLPPVGAERGSRESASFRPGLAAAETVPVPPRAAPAEVPPIARSTPNAEPQPPVRKAGAVPTTPAPVVRRRTGRPARWLRDRVAVASAVAGAFAGTMMVLLASGVLTGAGPRTSGLATTPAGPQTADASAPEAPLADAGAPEPPLADAGPNDAGPNDAGASDSGGAADAGASAKKPVAPKPNVTPKPTASEKPSKFLPKKSPKAPILFFENDDDFIIRKKP